VYIVYYEALNNFDGGLRQVVGAQATAGIWATYPQSYLSAFPGGFIDQVFGTALLMLLIFALADQKNSAPHKDFGPIMVGAVVVVIGMTFGLNAGYAINPARDLAPRLFTYVAGWGGDVFTAGNSWWWVPVVAPCLGAVLGGWMYQVFVGLRHPQVVRPPMDLDQSNFDRILKDDHSLNVMPRKQDTLRDHESVGSVT
jgi:glycerol uptake facilitator-like aquaporin